MHLLNVYVHMHTWVSYGSMMPLAGCTFKIPCSTSDNFHSNLNRKLGS